MFMISLFICNYVCASCFQKKNPLQIDSYCMVLLFIQLELLNYSNGTNCCLVVEKNVYKLLNAKQCYTMCL